MENLSSLLMVLVGIVVAAMIQPGAATEKLADCCEKVDKTEIKEEILGYLVQIPNGQCVQAVIFQTKSGLFCSQLNAPWVRGKIAAFRKAKALEASSSAAPSSTVSLLSIITSTASPSSSSATLPSSSLSPSPSSLSPTTFTSVDVTSEMWDGETFSEDKDE